MCNGKRNKSSSKDRGVGFVMMSVGTSLKSVLKLKNIESRIVNCLTAIGQATQNIIYYFRFTLTAKNKAEEMQEQNQPQELINQHKVLHKLGAASNLANITLPVVELVSIKNGWMNIGRVVIKELADGLNDIFFSRRRGIVGSQWLQEHLQ